MQSKVKISRITFNFYWTHRYYCNATCEQVIQSKLNQKSMVSLIREEIEKLAMTRSFSANEYHRISNIWSQTNDRIEISWPFSAHLIYTELQSQMVACFARRLSRIRLLHNRFPHEWDACCLACACARAQPWSIGHRLVQRFEHKRFIYTIA